MAAMVSVNGRIVDEAHAMVSVFDHGFLYGEGVYETVRTYHGQPFLVGRHLRRLRQSAQMLALRLPLTDLEIVQQVRDTMDAAQLNGGPEGEAYIRILVTRGVGEISYDPSVCTTPSIIVIVKRHVDPPADAYLHGVNVVIVSTVRNHPGTVNPTIKSNNLLNNALAMQEAVKRGGFEGVMRNYRGEIAECTTSNIFVVKDGEALTPPVESGLLPGITREFLFEVGRACEVPVRERVLMDVDLFAADEMFLTSTTRELVPIVRVDDRAIGQGMGKGSPGPITNLLLQTFRKQARELTEPRHAAI